MHRSPRHKFMEEYSDSWEKIHIEEGGREISPAFGSPPANRQSGLTLKCHTQLSTEECSHDDQR